MFSKVLVVMAVAATAVNAQIPGLSSCASQCILGAVSVDGCTTVTNIACVCGNGQFQADAGACLTQFCNATEIEAAHAAQSSACTNAITTITATNTATGINNITVTGLSTTATGSGSVSSVTATSVSGSAASSGSSSSGSTGTGTTATGTGSTSTGSTGTGSTPAESASTSTPTSAANSLVSNNGVVAFLAMIAGFLAL